jgi:hypothetical protein
MKQLKVGDTVTRLIAGIVRTELMVTEVTPDRVVCGNRTFDRATGAELDDELGWGAPPLTTGSFLVLNRLSDTVRRDSSCSLDPSSEDERTLAVAKLVGLVHQVVAESGCLDGFDAALWTAKFLRKPNPALGGRTPAEFMGSAQGREHVFDLILRMQSGTYS